MTQKMQCAAKADAAYCVGLCSVLRVQMQLRLLPHFGVKIIGGRCASRHTRLLPDDGCCILNIEKGCARENDWFLSFAQPLFL